MKLKINERRFYIWKNIAVISILLLYIWLVFMVRHDMITNPNKYAYDSWDIPPNIAKLQRSLAYITWFCLIATIIMIIKWYKALPPNSNFKIIIKEIDKTVNEKEDGEEDTYINQ